MPFVRITERIAESQWGSRRDQIKTCFQSICLLACIHACIHVHPCMQTARLQVPRRTQVAPCMPACSACHSCRFAKLAQSFPTRLAVAQMYAQLSTSAHTAVTRVHGRSRAQGGMHKARPADTVQTLPPRQTPIIHKEFRFRVHTRSGM